MLELWVEVHRPKTFNDFVWPDEQSKAQAKSWVTSGAVDNLMLTGPPGTGKTSLTGVLMNELKVGSEDVLRINASHEGNVEMMRDRVFSFITTGGWNGMKYVVIDEAGGASLPAQLTLKSMLEEHSSYTRFMLTENVKSKIIPPLQDRCTKLELLRPDRAKFEERMVRILVAERVRFDDEGGLEALQTIIDAHYPSLRACIRDLQRHSMTGKLVKPSSGETGEDWKYGILDLFKRGKIREAREMVSAALSQSDPSDIFTWLYRNSSLFANEDEAIVAIADHMNRANFCADNEINDSALFVKLSQIGLK